MKTIVKIVIFFDIFLSNLQLHKQKFHSKYSHIQLMSLIPYRDLKYLRLLTRVDPKWTPKEAAKVRQLLNNEIIKFQLNNPFVLHPFPPVTQEQIPLILLYMFKQMDQITIKSFSLFALQSFLIVNMESLIQVLVKETFHCQLFCQAFMRYLQQYGKNKELAFQLNKLKLTPFVDLFTAILERKKPQKVIKAVTIKDKQINTLIHTIYIALVFAASAKYIKQAEDEQLLENFYLQKAIKAGNLMIDECEFEEEFQSLREYLIIVSHLLIFNGMAARPIKMLEFCLDNKEGLDFGAERMLQVSPSLIERYINGLYAYCMLDPEYRLILLKVTRSFLSLNICNPMLIAHFEVLLKIIRSNVFLDFKKQVFDVLIDFQSRRNMTAIDQIFMRLLSSGIDLLDNDIQSFNLMLAQRGEAKRKEQFAVIYYFHYQQACNKIQPQVINFILEVYFEQDLPLEKLEIMVGREANDISAMNMKTLHSLIKEKQRAFHINLLSIILEKRREYGFKNSSKKASHPFITQDWLEAAGNNSEVYKIYLKLLTEKICEKTLEIYPTLINVKSIVVRVSLCLHSKIQGEFWSRSLEFYSIILKLAQKFDVFEQEVFRYFVLLQALFGEKLSTSSYLYFSKHFSKIAHPESTFLTFLENLVLLLKNKPSVFLYLQAVLQFQQHLKQLFFKKKLYDLSFLTTRMEESEFFRVSTYSFESVTVLYQLSLLVQDPDFQNDYMKIMRSWSGLMSRYQCKNLEYFVAFRQIKKIYPFLKERKMKDPIDRIKMIWDLIFKLIDHRQARNDYILMAGNKIIVDWKGQEYAKRGIKITGTFLRNQSLDTFWCVEMTTKQRTYIITLKNDRAIIETRQNNEDNNGVKEFVKEFNIKQLKKRPQKIDFYIKIEYQSKKLQILFKVQEGEVVDWNIDESIIEIKIGCKNNAILKNIKIEEAFRPGDITSITQHITPINRWEVKISSLNHLISQNFRQKFDFSHAYCCMGEMLRYFSHINLPFAYDIFIKLSTRLLTYDKMEKMEDLQVMFAIFNTIESTYSNIKGRGKTLMPAIQIDHAKQQPKLYYYLFVSALLPKVYWSNFTEQTKKTLAKILIELQQCQQFREKENKKFLLYDQCLQIAKDHPFFLEVCENIIYNHELNDVLDKKFKKLFLKANDQQSLKLFLASFLEKILEFLNLQNEQYLDKRLRCKFLIVDSENEQQLFKMCPIKSKIHLLHYYSQNLIFNEKGVSRSLSFIKELVGLIDASDRIHVMPWLIIQVKQLLFKQKQLKNQEKKCNFQLNYLYLQLLLMNRNVGNEEECQDINKFIHQLIEKLQLQIDNKNNNKQQKQEYESVFHSPIFIHFIKSITKDIIYKYANINVYGKQDIIVDIYQLSMTIITKFQKRNFLEFMTKYRYICTHDCKCLKALIQHESFKNLKLTHFSIFLQYLFQILLLIQQRSNLSYEQCRELIVKINEYLEFLLNSLDKKCNFAKSLFYSYPRLAGHKDGLQDIGKVLRRMKKFSNEIKCLEVRGGIYFKCVLITIKLMKLSPDLDYNNLVEHFLFGPADFLNREQNRQNQHRRTIPKLLIGQLVSPSTQTVRERSSIESYIADVNEEHKLYFNREDYPSNIQNVETDLTIYITDYLLMNVAEFLQENGEHLEIELLEKYTNSFLKGIANQKIGKEILISSTDNYQIVKYDDAIRFIQQSQHPKKEKSPQKVPISPAKTNRRPEWQAFEEINKNFSEKQKQGIQRQVSQRQGGQNSPRKTLKRKKTEDFSVQMKRRMDILDLIKFDSNNWFKRTQCKSISLYFCEQAKEIRILQIMHTHYVLKNELVPEASFIIARKDRMVQESYLKQFANYIKAEKRELLYHSDTLLIQKTRKVHKIFPYTSEKCPVLNIIPNSLCNMACPITLKLTPSDYDIRRQKHNESLYMNEYLTRGNRVEDESIYSEDQVSKYNQYKVQYDEIKESVIAEEHLMEDDIIIKQKPYCELVVREGSYFCQYRLEPSLLVLTSKLDRYVSDNLWYLQLGTHAKSLIHAEITEQISPDAVSQIFYRKFNQITNNSLEFFMKNGTSKFINFYRKENLASLIKHIEKVFKGIRIVKDPIKQFEDCKYTERWIEGNLSNFDYLMLLNKYSGRSYSDPNQYYVFPWVLKDYHCEKIDLTNPEVYRDLSKPIGALNPQKLKRYLTMYKNGSFGTEKCIYGSHYSTSLFICYYLIRLQPYSTLHRNLQQGDWDAADRIFNSIDQVWDSLCNESATSDIKECIPEFYYMPVFLKNIANIQLGKRQCGTYVGDVQLPPWAKSAQEFVVTMRAALESDYVSQNLHLWIDLIFGKHQYSEERYNIFHPFSYSDPEALLKFNGKNNKNIDGIICQINYFGQCPLQLFKKEHKPKKQANQIRQIRSTFINKAETSPYHTVIGEAYLPSGWKIIRVYVDNNEFIIQLQNVTKQEKQAVVISPTANMEALEESVENLEDIRKYDSKIFNEPKITINDQNQMSIGKEFLMDLDVRFNFSSTEVNEIWIACFGSKGIRIYNWQFELHWSWQNEEVRQVHLQATRLIFSTPNGKLYFYSLLDHKIHEAVVLKDACDMVIKVICLPRLPGRDKNQISYKILCIGDGQRICLASYTFEQSSNFTSQNRT